MVLCLLTANYNMLETKFEELVKWQGSSQADLEASLANLQNDLKASSEKQEKVC